nr:MAG TPA: hypothetical protein [Caudoviricetes sp.]
MRKSHTWTWAEVAFASLLTYSRCRPRYGQPSR